MPLDAASIMTNRVIAAKPDDTIAQVARQLAGNHISAMPVCDGDGALVGMISEGDLMRPLSSETETRRSWWLRMLAEGTQLAPEFLSYVQQDQRRVKDLMITQVVSVTEQTPVREIADLMMRHRIKRVPVLHDGKVVGIVARADLVRAMTQVAEEMNEML